MLTQFCRWTWITDQYWRSWGERLSRYLLQHIGAAVDIPHKVYKYLSYLGPKLQFLRLPKANKTEDEYLEDMFKEAYPIKFQKIREALNDYLHVFTIHFLIPNIYHCLYKEVGEKPRHCYSD